MKLKVIAIILLLSLLLFLGFKKVSANKNKEQSSNIEQLNILKYIPENNKLLFISNLNIFNIVNNNEKLKDDILIVFKIKPEKTIDDLLNLPNKIDQNDEIIPIKRENKINFLNYIFRTDDNYVIASSEKN